MKMNVAVLLLALLASAPEAFSQTVVVTDDNTYVTGQASSVLDVKSISKGFLAPRMTLAQRVAISSPAEGLLVYQIDGVKGFYYYTNTAWVALASGSSGSAWALTGNTATSSGTNFLGTTDLASFRIKTNAVQRMILDSLGNVGIGTAPSFTAGTFQEKFLVDAGVTGSYNAIVGRGSINNYLQLNIQNQSNGTSASSDVVATADNGTELVNYVDLGINSSTNSQNVMGAANDAYLYTTGNNLLIGTGTASKALVFMTGGTAQSSNERMRIDGSGKVGIGTTSPSSALHVAGTNPLTLTGVQTGANTDSILTIINGVVRKLLPSALVTSSTNAWSLVGNSATNPASNFLGTIDAQPLVIRTSNVQVGRFDANSLALGLGASIANSTNCYALGSGATIGFNKVSSMALGSNAAVSNDSSFSIGVAAVTSGQNSFSVGPGSQANSTNSFAIGRNAYVGYSTIDALAIGTNATTGASNSIAIGSNTTIASKTTATAPSSIAVGNAAGANSANAIAIGTGANVGYNLTNPVAIGFGAVVNGSNSIAIGNGANVSSISNATALGAGASVTSTANNSTAIGYNTNATLPNELILGDRSNQSLSVGIGTETFSGSNREKFLVDAGATSSVNAIVGRGTINNYLQLNIQNLSNGNSSSSDVVATADNGSETTNFVDMGINGSTNNSGIMGGFNDAYLYNIGQNFLIGTGTAAKALIFMTGGTTQSANERMRIDGTTGFVGIGTLSPATALHVAGTNPLTLNGVQTGAISDSILTIASGTVRKLPFSTLTTGSSWSLTGNTGTSSGTNYLGTTDLKSLRFRSNALQGMILDSLGNVGVGLTPAFTAGAFQEKFLVDAGVTGSVNAIVGRGSINNYLQLNIQNQSSGTSASSDVVATADNGSETTNFVDMGINSSTNSSGVMGAANDAYLYNIGQNFLMGTGTAAKSLVFMTGGTTQATNERMRIDGSGNVGIGINAPAQKLDVTGNFRLTGAFMPGGSAGTSGYFLTSAGAGLAPTWIDATPFLSSLTWELGGNSVASLQKLGTTTNFDLPFITNNVERMRILGSGNVGIGTTAPATALHVAGTNPLTLNGVQVGATSDSILTIASGTVRKLPFSTLTSGTSWSLAGNTGTSSGTNYLGTTDLKSLRFRSNALQGMVLDSLGNVGIGAAPAFTAGTNQEKFLVDAGVTNSFNAIVGRGSVNNYLQLNIQNQSSGTSASSDVVATADNGSETFNFVDMGINSSTNNSGVMGGANDAYLYNIGQNFLIGTGVASKSLIFMSGGTAQSTNERMRIDGSGHVGIGLTNSNNPLAVKDTLEIRRTGALSELLFSNTAGSGDFRIAGDGGDIFWQGGGGRNLQMGAYWGVVLAGDRQTATIPALSTGVANTGVLVLAQRDVSVPLAIQANSSTQSANLTEWRSATATLDVVDKNGNVGIGTTSPASALHVVGANPLTLTGVQTGAVSDSILTIASGTVRKLPFSTLTSGSSWSLAGNTGTSSGTNYLGTTDLKSLRFRSNALQGMVLDSLGNIGIGTNPSFTAGTNQEKFLVDAGVTNSFNAIVGRGSINNYLQLNIQNQSSGTSASSDVVATADNGSETTNFVDMGINSSTNSSGIMGAANDSYLYNIGQNFLMGTGTASKSLVFMTGGTTQSTNERMRIDGSGNVGIGSNNPGNKLEVNSGIAGASGLRLKQLPAGAVLFTSATADVAQNNNNFYFDATNYRLGISAGTAPNSTLQVGGSMSLAIVVKTVSYTVQSSDYTIECNNTSGAITITLPSAAGVTGRVYIIKKISSAGNNVIIDGSGTETIDGSLTNTIVSQYGAVTIQSDGSNWIILSAS